MSEEEIPKISNKKTKSYFCKNCLENNIEKFIEGRYSSCRKCINASKIKSRAEKNIEKSYDKLEDKDIFLLMEKYINTSFGFIEGKTIKELLEKVKNFDETLEKIKDNKISDENEYIKLANFYALAELKNKFNKQNLDRALQEQENLKEKVNNLEEENEFLKQQILYIKSHLNIL